MLTYERASEYVFLVGRWDDKLHTVWLSRQVNDVLTSSVWCPTVDLFKQQ